MERVALLEELKKKPDIDLLAANCVEDGSTIPLLLDIIEQDTSAIKFTCEKIIRRLSEKNP
ncbi:MAG: hypothetical protein HGA54_05405, partial [Actinobacteria bacterium]|nr:hypothetical protein [Actinomycetota bacterium]